MVNEKRSLIEILNSDADFLASCNIIDYSLLLGEIQDDPELVVHQHGVYISACKKPYLFGVIDPLTGFNLQKRCEYGLKRIRYGTEMSCVPPQLYAQRFKRFVAQSFTLN